MSRKMKGSRAASKRAARAPKRKSVKQSAELSEALALAAVSDIQRVITQSPTDPQPVFDAIVNSGARLFEGKTVSLRLVKADYSELVASTDAASQRRWPLNDDHSVTTRVIKRGAVIQVADMLADPDVPEPSRQRARERGFRGFLSAPLVRDGKAIGVITVTRAAAGPFNEKEVALLKTFADQAVIAIENVRLFKELQASNTELTQALEQQVGTSEILSVISKSPTDVAPVFDTIMRSAARLCGSQTAALFRFDGQLMHVAATPTWPPETIDELTSRFPCPPTRGSVSGRAILERSIVRIPDALADPDYDRGRAVLGRWRRAIGIPLLRQGVPIGAIALAWPEPGETPEDQVALLKTFSDQAVIAIENVRLFEELEARNAQVTESLEQQTAIAEILRVISSNPIDVMPVLDAVTRQAAQLCDAPDARLFLVEGDILRYVAGFGELRELPKTLPLSRGVVTGRAILDQSVIHIEDLAATLDEFPDAREPQQAIGHRTTLAVPLVRENKAFGGIVMVRNEIRPFTDKQIELIKTFAYQATIALENVRLFNEIQEKSRQLEIASKHKSEFLANMSHELRTPLNAIIGFSEVLLEKMFGEMNEKQEEYLKDINSSGGHLLSLINDILDLSKVEAGRMELEVSEFDLPTALQVAMTLVRERAQNHGITLELHVDPQVGEIRADERKVKQILLNLLSNAVKFTPDGGRIDLDARLFGDSVQVSVKDTGVGIALEDQAAVFEEFRQVGRDRTTKVEGTGLGLALTRRFVELHGGRIGLESEPGKGSTFTFTLPLTPVTAGH